MTSLVALRVDCDRHMETIEVEEYDSGSGATTPGEDIWSKFEMEGAESLYPTPPLSPDNKVTIGAHEGISWQTICDIDQSSFEDEQPSSWLPEQSIDLTPLLDLELEQLGLSKRAESKVITNPPELSKSKGLKKSLIQDCMWSAYKKLLQKDSEKVATPVGANTVENIYNECNQPSDCVDPTAVFPYPLSMTETNLDFNIAGTTTPSDSDEEIDVVTIATVDSDSAAEEKKKSKKDGHHHHHKQKHRKHWEVSCSTPEHDYAKPEPRHFYKVGRTMKRSKNSSSFSHHAKKRKLSGVNPEEVKKALEGLDVKSRNYQGIFNPASSRGSSRASSRGSSNVNSHSASDSEDCDKRVNHNVLERKRREDLRSAFFRLRDRIPELESKERASKVVILEKSRTYCLELSEEQEILVSEKERLNRHHKELMARLRKLRTSILG